MHDLLADTVRRPRLCDADDAGDDRDDHHARDEQVDVRDREVRAGGRPHGTLLMRSRVRNAGTRPSAADSDDQRGEPHQLSPVRPEQARDAAQVALAGGLVGGALVALRRCDPSATGVGPAHHHAHTSAPAARFSAARSSSNASSTRSSSLKPIVMRVATSRPRWGTASTRSRPPRAQHDPSPTPVAGVRLAHHESPLGSRLDERAHRRGRDAGRAAQLALVERAAGAPEPHEELPLLHRQPVARAMRSACACASRCTRRRLRNARGRGAVRAVGVVEFTSYTKC